MSVTPEMLSVMQCIATFKGPVGASTLCNDPGLGMSQATIGRQLAALEELGYVKKVSNKGRVLTEKGTNYLRQNDISTNNTLLAEELVNLSSFGGEEQLAQIIIIRQLLEPYAAQQAAQFATDADIQDIENLVFAHRYRLSQNKPAHKEDLMLHLLIAKVGKNLMLYKILELLLSENNAYVEFSKAGDTHRDTQVAQHFKLLAALQKRDSLAAVQAMSEHLKSVYSDILECQNHEEWPVDEMQFMRLPGREKGGKPHKK